jgi:hypothetical protein
MITLDQIGSAVDYYIVCLQQPAQTIIKMAEKTMLDKINTKTQFELCHELARLVEQYFIDKAVDAAKGQMSSDQKPVTESSVNETTADESSNEASVDAINDDVAKKLDFDDSTVMMTTVPNRTLGHDESHNNLIPSPDSTPPPQTTTGGSTDSGIISMPESVDYDDDGVDDSVLNRTIAAPMTTSERIQSPTFTSNRPVARRRQRDYTILSPEEIRTKALTQHTTFEVGPPGTRHATSKHNYAQRMYEQRAPLFEPFYMSTPNGDVRKFVSPGARSVLGSTPDAPRSTATTRRLGWTPASRRIQPRRKRVVSFAV